MRQSQSFVPTVENPIFNEDLPVCQLLQQAGYIRHYGRGKTIYLPLAMRIFKKIEAIVYEEVEQLQAVEIKTSTLQPTDLMEAFSIPANEQAQLLISKDAKQSYVVSHLHAEQLLTHIAEDLRYLSQTNINFYQVMTDVQSDQSFNACDLMNAIETTKLAIYTFQVDKETEGDMRLYIAQTFEKILNALTLRAYSLPSLETSEEEQFLVPTKNGDLTLALNAQGTYYDWFQTATSSLPEESPTVERQEIKKISSALLCKASDGDLPLEFPKNQQLLTRIYLANEQYVAVVYLGEDEISEEKIKRVLHAPFLKTLSDEELEAFVGCKEQFVGPFKLPVGVEIIADQRVQSVVNGIAGANEDNHYLIHVDAERDFGFQKFVDLRLIHPGEESPDGLGIIEKTKAVEVATVRTLNDQKLKTALAHLLNEKNEDIQVNMGVHDMNLSRIFALLAEQYYDENGFKWPRKLAPYDVHLIGVESADELYNQRLMDLYHILQAYRYDVLFDDRDQPLDLKYRDADLIGIPIQLTIDERWEDGILHVKFRETNERVSWQIEEVTEKLQAYFSKI